MLLQHNALEKNHRLGLKFLFSRAVSAQGAAVDVLI